MSITLQVEPNYVSPYVFACFVTLKEKGLDFELREIDGGKGETRAPEYLTQTLTGRVPSLAHDGFSLAESSAIIEYLDEAFPAVPVLPRGTHDRARARQLMSWMRSDDTASIRSERPSTTLFYAPPGKPLSEEAQRAADKLYAVASRVLDGGKLHAFDAWSIVDAELAFLLMRLVAGGDEVPEELRAYTKRQWERPSVSAFADLPRPPLAV
jgi:glutathione S-transferase